ncbi:DUF4234 domain-containing protein [Lachnospiraceae bacterium 62-35]
MIVKKRSFWMLLLLSTVTCGLYSLFWWFCFIEDTNRICAGRSLEKPSPNYFIVILLSCVTCGIYPIIWLYKQGNRLADAAASYNINNHTTGSTLLLWDLFGSLLCCAGPFICLYMWIDLFNKVADAYNTDNPEGGYPTDSGGPSVPSSGIAALAQKLEEGASNLASRVQSSKGISDMKKKAGDKIKVPSLSKEELLHRFLVTSKYKSSVNRGNVRASNTGELCYSEAPLLIPQFQIADISQEGNVGLFLSFQNLSDKNIAAIYLDLVCYNMLKEQVGLLTDLCYIDLNVEKGHVFETPAPISLPDKTVRHCDIIIRHVVYTDESIWNYEGSEAFIQIDEQQMLNLPDGLNHEFKRQMKALVPDVDFQYMPEDRGTYWFCACGQLNRAGDDSCFICGADRSRQFSLLDTSYLAEQRNIHMEEERIAREEAERQEAARRAQEEALRAQRAAERNQKLEEAQQKAKNAFNVVKNRGAEYYAKGEEKLKGAVIFQKSGHEGADNMCPKCGKPYNPGDKFCMGCGLNLQQAAIPAPLPVPTSISDSSFGTEAVPEPQKTAGKICQKCGMENEEDSKFCMGCGNLLEGSLKFASQAPVQPSASTSSEQPSFGGTAMSAPKVVSTPEASAPQGTPITGFVSQPSGEFSASFAAAAPEEDQDELRTVVMTPAMSAHMAEARQNQEKRAGSEIGTASSGQFSGSNICPACGYENEPGSMFCMGCGSRID